MSLLWSFIIFIYVVVLEQLVGFIGVPREFGNLFEMNFKRMPEFNYTVLSRTCPKS